MKVAGIYGGYIPKINFKQDEIKPTLQQWNDLRVFNHHIYEYKKGLRNLVLTTEKSSNRDIIVQKLENQNISYLIQPLGDKNINVFFGNPDSVAVIKSFNQPKLNQYTPEQDFILGILLGYDKIQECQRYLKWIADRR